MKARRGVEEVRIKNGGRKVGGKLDEEWRK
jgi:hypothetical protein